MYPVPEYGGNEPTGCLFPWANNAIACVWGDLTYRLETKRQSWRVKRSEQIVRDKYAQPLGG
jgi:hypothetical protein